MIEEAIRHHADPHPKKALRIASMEDVLEHNILFKEVWNLPRKYALYKCKVFEVAKPGKTIRCIGDLGCPASLQGFRVTALTKAAMDAEPIYINGGEIMFCKMPSHQMMTDVFTKLINPPGRFFFVYFSDDSCLSIRLADGSVLRCNLDISSCDASHTSSLFESFIQIHPKRVQKDVKGLVAQCKQSVTVVDPNHIKFRKKRKVTLQPKSPRLYSGSTITTSINNLACILIGHSISSSTITNPRDVMAAALRVGYIVTCEVCSDWHTLQFLKHSPVLDTKGNIQPLLNIGVILRMSGTAKGDFIGSREESIKTRVDRQQRSLLQGAVPNARYTLIDNMKKSCAVGNTINSKLYGREHERNYTKYDTIVHKKTTDQLSYKVVQEEVEEFHVSSAEVFCRYSLNDREIAELEDEFGNAGCGDHYASSGIDKIYAMDYQLSTKYLTKPPITIIPTHHSILPFDPPARA
jgi:hypothetical protein